MRVSDIKLFRLQAGKAVELQGDASDLEKPLQTLIEANSYILLGVRFLATEYSTGKTHAGRIDSLGLDENNCPVIVEYKQSVGENVINQGLFYLDWLMDHQAEFKLLVMDKLGKPAADAIDWTAPRLVCIAADFTKYDSHAVQQINRNIELIRYRRFGEELLLELANAASTIVPHKARLLVYLHVDPDRLQPLPLNCRDVRQQGHWGTGDLELTSASQADLDMAKPLILMAYDGRAAAPAMTFETSP